MKKFAAIVLASLLVSAVFQGVAFSDEDFGGPEIIYTEPVVGVIFSHKTHVGDFGFDCDACHSGLFEMEALAAQREADFTMEALYQGKYCGACHDGSTAFASNTQCATCHIGVKGWKRANKGK